MDKWLKVHSGRAIACAGAPELALVVNSNHDNKIHEACLEEGWDNTYETCERLLCYGAF